MQVVVSGEEHDLISSTFNTTKKLVTIKRVSKLIINLYLLSSLKGVVEITFFYRGREMS